MNMHVESLYSGVVSRAVPDTRQLFNKGLCLRNSEINFVIYDLNLSKQKFHTVLALTILFGICHSVECMNVAKT